MWPFVTDAKRAPVQNAAYTLAGVGVLTQAMFLLLHKKRKEKSQEKERKVYAGRRHDGEPLGQKQPEVPATHVLASIGLPEP